MQTFFQPRALLQKTLKFKNNSGKAQLSRQNYSTLRHAVAVFSHHRDVKVALDDLHNSGFSHDLLMLTGRNAQKCGWYPELVVRYNFEGEKFNFSQIAQEFFSRLYLKGKYLILISGSQHDVHSASKIVSRRQGHADIWGFE